ncbi:MAG: hypothetical protein JW940_20760 [Polyangiaceae bacterium]|nr:hypothetical protein [Polyangiaceae bacterium]
MALRSTRLRVFGSEAYAVLFILAMAAKAHGQEEPVPNGGAPSAPPEEQADTAADEAGAAASGEPRAARPEAGSSLAERLDEQQRRLDAQHAELEQLRSELEVAASLAPQVESAPSEDRFRVYGFMDAGLRKQWWGHHAYFHSIGASNAPTFVFGNLNLYFDSRPTPDWRGLAEIRFTSYPDGTIANPTGTSFERQSTLVFDIDGSSGSWGQVRYGSIVLERAHIDWTPADWFQVTTGYWLTPYGIWNVDHGTPTLISLMPPQFVVMEEFPARQLGIQIHGVIGVQPPWDLAYHAYISNGRYATLQDPTPDKMLGGRLALQSLLPFPMAFGGSFFSGENATEQRQLTSASPFTVDSVFPVDYKEFGFAADASADFGRLRIRTEGVFTRRNYRPGKHAPGWYPGTLMPSTTRWGFYALAAYQLPWAGIEPYLFYELERLLNIVGDNAALYSAGLNFHFTEAAQLKTQFTYAHFFDFGDTGHDHSDQDGKVVDARLVVAF